MSEQLDPRYSTMDHMPPPLQPQAKISSGRPVVLCQLWVNRYHDTVLLNSPTSEYRRASSCGCTSCSLECCGGGNRHCGCIDSGALPITTMDARKKRKHIRRHDCGPGDHQFGACDQELALMNTIRIVSLSTHTAQLSTKKERQRADPRDHPVPKPLAQ